MSTPGCPTARILSPSAMDDIATVFDILHDLLLDIHNSSGDPTEVRRHAAEALEQVDEGRIALALEGGAA